MSESTNTNGLEIVDLWPDGPPHPLEGVGPEAGFVMSAAMGEGTAMFRNVNRPSVTVHRPDPGNDSGIGVVVVPGGGMVVLAWEHEGENVGNWLAANGVTAIVVKHRVAPTPESDEDFQALVSAMSKHAEEKVPAAQGRQRLAERPDPPGVPEARVAAMADVRRAIELAHQHADSWGIDTDKIGLLGFSAGSDLVVRVTMDPQGPKPAFVAACYGGDTHGEPVPADSPPLFVVAAQDDTHSFRVSTNLFMDWSLADRPAELHVFTEGGHAFGLADGQACGAWTDLFLRWASDLTTATEPANAG
jgi:dienelactone hydrolase